VIQYIITTASSHDAFESPGHPYGIVIVNILGTHWRSYERKKKSGEKREQY
jgi:hypothetical protein